MRPDWWAPVVQWTLWGVVMALVMGALARARLRSRPEKERRTLRHPPSTLWLGLINAAFFFGIAVASNTIWKNASTTIWTTLAFAAFGLLSVPILADYFFGRHRLTESGLAYGRMFGSRGTLAWEELKEVRFDASMKWFVLKTAGGATVRVSAMLMGLPELAAQLLLHAPATTIEPATRRLLEETRDGRPPSVWG